MLTRRDFVAKLAVAGVAAGAFALAPGAAWTSEASASREQSRQPVVSFTWIGRTSIRLGWRCLTGVPGAFAGRGGSR